ncbi:hypothetical protein THASP1DRAFT_30612 [Thamnocephalis sphaerospora]|uniref:Uncharacterized protein n=1 Tax=Thamnocephalis sphaerospora TaxID=78915 RepID=A0A4P9XNL9_9FUNG|nr:hypothetical protein THASP1DRAFT_30612 [Thamnocephalis sphaerospora]|eukprot:RKP07577.1 hypothetical protein THASP1DRAFT_30612 [Thamnocephalis sphaerospora]
MPVSVKIVSATDDAPGATVHQLLLPPLHPGEDCEKSVPLDLAWLRPPLSVRVTLEQTYSSGDAVALDLATCTLNLLAFTSLVPYAVPDDMHLLFDDETSEIALAYNALVCTGNRSTSTLCRTAGHDAEMESEDTTTQDAYVLLPLDALASRLGRYTLVTDGQSISGDQLYPMLLALLLGENHSAAELERMLLNASYAQFYIPVVQECVQLVLTRGLARSDQVHLRVVATSLWARKAMCAAIQNRVHALLA